jgi:predicted DNA-binding transcriptional regulator AlpA
MSNESQYIKPANENAARNHPRKQRTGSSIALSPRGLARGEAATYVGVSSSFFDKLVEDGLMPTPKHIGSRRVWDRLELDDAFDALPTNDNVNPWDAAVAS